MRISYWSSDVCSSDLQRREFWRMTEHAGTEFLAIDAARSGGAGKARLDRRDQRAARPLQPMHLGIGVEHRHAFAFEHRGRGRLAHADRAGEPEDEGAAKRSEEHTSELQSLMRTS